MSTWEERMSTNVHKTSARLGEFARWSKSDDPEGILLEIIAARCLGIEYGDPGPLQDLLTCTECWDPRYQWLGNTWGMNHTGNGGTMNNCKHYCHEDEDEVWIG